MSNDKILKMDSTIRDSLEFYDKNQELYSVFFNKIKYIKFIDNINMTDDIIFYDENKKILLESSYEILGVFLPKTQLWKWSWSIPSFNKKHTFISRKILEYAFNLDNNKEISLRSDLTNSKIKIVNDLQLDIHIALSSYIGKQPLIFKFYNKFEDNTELKKMEKSNSEQTLQNSESSNKINRTSENLNSISNTKNISSSNSSSDDDIFKYVSDDDDDENYMIMYLFILDYKNITI
jgi:hypothetical protein